MNTELIPLRDGGLPNAAGADTQHDAIQMAAPSKPATAASATRILVIDDNRKLCRLTQSYLEPLGYRVQATHTGPEGAELAVAESWHAVILDLMLPGCDGFEVLKRIRKQSAVPVLMLTARGDEADRIVGLELGADDYLPKTFSTRELLARLRAVTRRSTQATGGDADEEVTGATCASIPRPAPRPWARPRSRTRPSSSTCCSR